LVFRINVLSETGDAPEELVDSHSPLFSYGFKNGEQHGFSAGLNSINSVRV
jgi:hypothetical protein